MLVDVEAKIDPSLGSMAKPVNVPAIAVNAESSAPVLAT